LLHSRIMGQQSRVAFSGQARTPRTTVDAIGGESGRRIANIANARR